MVDVGIVLNVGGFEVSFTSASCSAVARSVLLRRRSSFAETKGVGGTGTKVGAEEEEGEEKKKLLLFLGLRLVPVEVLHVPEPVNFIISSHPSRNFLPSASAPSLFSFLAMRRLSLRTSRT